MQVARWGNSLAVRIPVGIARLLGIREGDDIDLKPGADGAFYIVPDGARATALAAIDALSRPFPAGWKVDFDSEDLRGPDVPDTK